MSLLQPAKSTSAFLKMGLMGFQGAGKTYTATNIAVGLVTLMRKLELPAGKLPVAFFDTEKGSDWMIKRVNDASVDLVTRKSRSFSDLLAVMDEAESGCSVLVIDSLTHVWKEFCQAYLRAKKRSFLKFDDWGYLKGEQGWQQFTDKYINSNLHIIFCGRAGFEYDMSTDDESGKKILEKTGIKLKAEGETGYEPDLYVLMERRMNMESKADEHIAHVIKDRSTLLDGKEFADPTFETFLPHIECLALGGKQLGVDASRTSDAMIPRDARDNRAVQRAIVLDEIGDLMTLHIPGQAAVDKKRKVELLRKHWGASWTEMEKAMPLEQLRGGYDSLHQELEGKRSRYAAPAPTAINDSLPNHSAAPAGDGLDIPAYLDRRSANGVPAAAAVVGTQPNWTEEFLGFGN